jgi:threonine dehydrogenase-like Zn-dependent dehydrogenase
VRPALVLSQHMLALYWDGHTARLGDHPVPQAGRGMAVIRVSLAGICNTDLEITKGYMQFRGILGHEFVGVVDDGPPEWRGARVVGEINFACGHCVWCARGLGRHCPARRTMGILNADGAFAERVAVPLTNLHRVPDRVPDDVAVFTEPLAAAFEILEQVHVTAASKCVVFGDGKLGLLIAQVLFLTGARVLAVGKHASKLAWLRARGIDTATLAEWKGPAADLVVEASGSAAGFAAAVAATKARGTLVLKSTVAQPTPVDLTALVINEVTIIGSRCGSFRPALRALASGAIDVRPLVSARRPLKQAVEALALAAEPGTLKVLLAPE